MGQQQIFPLCCVNFLSLQSEQKITKPSLGLRCGVPSVIKMIFMRLLLLPFLILYQMRLSDHQFKGGILFF